MKYLFQFFNELEIKFCCTRHCYAGKKYIFITLAHLKLLDISKNEIAVHFQCTRNTHFGN